MRCLIVILSLFAVGLASGADASPKRIAISFDDVPRRAGAFFTPDQRSDALIAGLKKAGVKQAGFFVTTGNLDKPDGAGGAARIQKYAAAGHTIANHSHSHSWLRKADAADYLADLDMAEAWLGGKAGKRPWYRFPYLDEGGKDVDKRNAIRKGLDARGLQNAYVTVDNYDWHIDRLANAAKRRGKSMDMEALRDLYVETLTQAADFYDKIAVTNIGRSPAHVLLLHETDLAALFIVDLTKGFRTKGWTIISMDEAYADPIAKVEPETWFLGSGRVAALAHMKGVVPRSLVHERTDEKVLDRLFADRVLKESQKETQP